jgi:hypothetical protein
MNPRSRKPFCDVAAGLPAYAVSSTVVLLAALFGFQFLQPPPGGTPPNQDYWDALNRFDGGFYRDIAAQGYSLEGDNEPKSAFFPAYPLLIRAGWLLTGARLEWVALAVSHGLLAISFVLLHLYVRLRTNDVNAAAAAVLGLGVLPATIFFRVGYSESTFFVLVMLFLVSVERGWPSVWLALFAGLASGARAPGVALTLAFLVELRRRSASNRDFVLRALVLGPLACGGLLAFIGYQWLFLGEPLAFIRVQERWGHVGASSWRDVVGPLLTGEPGWGTFDTSSPRHWSTTEHHPWAVFSLVCANPVLWGLTLLAILWGAWRRWLTRAEVVLALGLLAIPYFTKGYSNSMNSFGRFAAVVAPAYLVLGRLLAAWPKLVVGLAVLVSAFWLIVYAAFFGAGWPVM